MSYSAIVTTTKEPAPTVRCSFEGIEKAAKIGDQSLSSSGAPPLMLGLSFSAYTHIVSLNLQTKLYAP